MSSRDFFVAIKPEYIVKSLNHNVAVKEFKEFPNLACNNTNQNINDFDNSNSNSTNDVENTSDLIGEIKVSVEENNKVEHNIDNLEHVIANQNSTRNDRGRNDRGRNKKRPRENRVSQENRLCSFISKGLTCKYSGQCTYNHDPLDFLSKKPSDLGDSCYQYMMYGWCNNGLMCRFGKCHIDYTTGKNLVRSDKEGGIIDRYNFNVLSKLVQIDLRKRKYDFKTIKPNQLQRCITIAKGNTTEPDPFMSNEVDSSGDITNTVPSGSNDSMIEKLIDDIIKLDDIKDYNVKKCDNQPDYPDLSAYDSFVKLVDFSNKVYVAPLTTVGNLPFRRILKDFGADITCGEMAMASNLLEGQSSEWALLRRHSSEDIFGIQIAGSHPDILEKTAMLLENETLSNFVDLNCGCPIDIVCNRGCGSALLNKHNKLCDIVKVMGKRLNRSITVKIRTGWDEKNPSAHKLIPQLQKLSNGKLSAIMIHGRSRLQRYSRLANWEYIYEVANAQNRNLPLIPIIGNGDIFSRYDWESHQNLINKNIDDKEIVGLCSCAMIGRGALVKPWLPTEIKDNRDIDISSTERLDILKNYCNYGFEHWGSDQQGINTTRRFLLEWLSFLHRYVPVGLIEQPQKMSQRPPHYFGRCDMETLMASGNSKDWIRISELLLGPVDDNFEFVPKHKSSSYAPGAEDSISNG